MRALTAVIGVLGRPLLTDNLLTIVIHLKWKEKKIDL